MTTLRLAGLLLILTFLFLSYSRADSDTMGRVREALTGEGLSVWTDENLTPGTPSWKQAIERAIEDAGCQNGLQLILLMPEIGGGVHSQITEA